MTTTSAVARLADEIGFDIGGEDSRTQADLFNGFARGWTMSMKNETDRGYQAAYVVDSLTPAARTVLTALAGAVQAWEETQ